MLYIIINEERKQIIFATVGWIKEEAVMCVLKGLMCLAAAPAVTHPKTYWPTVSM